MTRRVLVLCPCCALKLANDDDSGCRDYHRHDHPGLKVPASTVVTQGPHTWEGTYDLTCHGHADGRIAPLGEFWVAEVFTGKES